jgi:iron complex outermembrane recepter protein
VKHLNRRLRKLATGSRVTHSLLHNRVHPLRPIRGEEIPMKQSNILKAGVAPLALGVALAGAPAFAQDDQTTTTSTTAEQDTAIVVTGSLIRNPNLEQANPVIVTTSDQIELKQSNVAEEVLREIPGVVANVGSATNNGNGGSSYVDLRGLGSNRNIVLLDGNRTVPVDLVGRVDLNNIPLALISRVDALTGAAVTTYGADAITGVINFVTRKDFAGIEAAAGYQLTERGDGAYFRGDVTVGANFDDGRGNAVLSVGYQESDPVYQGQRDFSINQISSFTGGGAGSGTSVPSRLSGTRPLIPGTNTPNTDPTVANGGLRQINAAGQAVGTFATFNFNPYNIFQTPFKRYNIFAQANYQASDNVEVYTRGMFTKNSVSTIIAPSGSFGGTVTINLNNPFLPATLRNQFCAFDVDTGPGYTPRFTPAECAAAALATGPTDARYRTVTVTLNRRTVEVGPRISEYNTQVFDYRLGLRGAITDTIDWDISGSYGESEKVQRIQNYTLQSRFRQGTLVNLVGGVPTCQDTSNGCVPVNIFGPAGSITPAAADFLSEASTTTVTTTLAQARALVSGDFGFAFPSADEPIGFALGAEFRDYGAKQQSDTLAKTPGELGGAGGAAPDIDGGYKVYEGFAELIVPIVADAPLFHSLTVEGGARYSKYEVEGGGSNDAWTYKVGASWEPVEDIKFRGNYARAVRAPNISELFTPRNTVLTNLGVDPCAGAAPVTNANLRAVCLAQGAPVGSIGNITNPTAGQANITTAGNINLDPETATTWTVGAVFQPTFLPGFTASVDYYNIKVDDVIGAPLPGDLIAACFGNLSAASATNPDCTAIRRNPFTGGLDGDPAITGGLFAPLNNLGVLRTDGIDLVMNFQRDLGFARLALNFVGNWTNSSRYKATPSSIDRECVGFYSVNCSFTGSIQPEFQFTQRTTLSFDQVDVSLLWRWIDEVYHEPADIVDQGEFFRGTLPASAGPIAGREVDFNVIEEQHYFDLTARWNVNDNFTFTFAVQNLFDNEPPIVGNTAGATTFNSGNTYPATYEALGRRYAVGAKLRF